MKKLTIKLSHDQLTALNAWLEAYIGFWPDQPLYERSALALLQLWHLTKVCPKTMWPCPPGEYHRLKLDAPLAFALQAFIGEYGVGAGQYLGNKLIQLQGEIDQRFYISNS